MPTFPAGDPRGRAAPAGAEVPQEHGPHVFDEAMRAAYLELVRAGMGLTKAAVRLGFKAETVRRARKLNREFDQAVSDAEEEMCEDLELMLVQAGRAGDVQAAKYVLNNRAPRRWKEGSGVAVQVNADNAAVLVEGDPAERAASLERFRLELEARKEALVLPDESVPAP